MSDLPRELIPGSEAFKDAFSQLNSSVQNANESADKANESIGEISQTGTETSQKIAKNTNDIKNVAKATSTNKQLLKNHESLRTAHGSNGQILGRNDVADRFAAGVVLQAWSVSELGRILITVPAAPDDYDKNYAQQQTNAINSLKSKMNDIIDKINEIIDGQKDAGQMDQ